MPNWSQVKSALKIIFKRNGKSTTNGICLLKNILITEPKEIAIIMYNTVHTGPKIQLGGAHVGFSSSL
jgi:hypothetical protein